MKTALLASGLFVSALISGVSDAGWFGPSTYHECVLEHIKDAKGLYASSLVQAACRNKFPYTPEEAEAQKREANKRCWDWYDTQVEIAKHNPYVHPTNQCKGERP